MDDLISRQEVIKKLDEALERITKNVSKESDAYNIVYGTVDITKCMIMTLPPIQPKLLQPWEVLVAQAVLPQPEPKRGKWIDTGGNEEWYAREYRCSECGDTMLGEANFCPNCGAKMEVPE